MRNNKIVMGNLSGFSLLEILITIIVISIAASAIMGVYISTVRTSADPLIQQQAIAIAEAYMEEIQLKSFNDPDGVEAGEVRSTFDDVDDYDLLNDVGARDQNDNAIADLSAFTVQVAINGRTLTGSNVIGASDSLRIDVTVTHPVIDPIILSGFRTNF